MFAKVTTKTASADHEHSRLFRVEQIMGMPIVIDVRDREVAPEALDRAFAWFRLVDARFSTYKPESEICRLNRGELQLAEAHADVREVIARCEELVAETGGFFDIRAPLRSADRAVRAPSAWQPVDPSGLVKGWSVMRAAHILEGEGACNFAINAGGDIVARGRPVPEPRWRFGIQHPLLRDQVAAVVEVRSQALATSGAYERGTHIVDPHTGQPPRGVLSVTICGQDLATVDAYATAAYAMGEAGPAWTARLAGYEAMTIMADQTVLSTMGFPKGD